MNILRTFLLTLLLLAGLGMGFIYSGLYPMGADEPHSKLTYQLLETMRERSIKRASETLLVPDLDQPKLLLSGGPDYHEMCVSCHLQPEQTQSDMSLGLYPVPPNLALERRVSLSEQEPDQQAALSRRDFWIIKHGIKASGMPAWGITHDDERIWAMVAFLRKLPELSLDQYQILTVRSEPHAAHH